MSSRDFLTKRIKTGAIIGSGDIVKDSEGVLQSNSSPALLIYPSTSAINNVGGHQSLMLQHVGTDVVNFFSGSIGSMVYTLEDGTPAANNGERGVNLFGGDIHVSGTLFVQGSVISGDQTLGEESLKAYEEFGDFLKGQELTGEDTVALGNHLTASSALSMVIGYDNSILIDNAAATSNLDKYKFIFGGRENTIYTKNSEIYGGENNEISGSGDNLLILKSKNSTIHPIYKTGIDTDLNPFNSSIIFSEDANISGSSTSHVIFSDGAEIIGPANGVAIASPGSIIKGSGENNITFGEKNNISGEVGEEANLNILFGRYGQLYKSKENFAIGLDNQFNDGNLNTKTKGNFSLTGSSNNFAFLKDSHLDNSNNNVVFSKQSTLTDVNNGFIVGDNLTLNNTDNNFIASSNIEINNFNNNFIANLSQLDTTSPQEVITKPNNINNLIQLKKDIGIPDNLNTLSLDEGYNTILSSKGSKLLNSSFSFILGGFNQEISGINNGILGGFGNSIKNLSFGSYILGGYDNQIDQVTESIVIGNKIRQNASSSILIGNDISNSINNYYIIGDGKPSINQINRNSAVVLSASYFKFGELSQQELYGTEVNFFASGSMGARERHFDKLSNGEASSEYGVAVFGGDVHISGTLSGGNFGLEELFHDGGDSKGRNRTLGNNDNFNLDFLTNGKKRLQVSNQGSVFIGTGEGSEYPLLHLRTGSHNSYNFDSSHDLDPAKKFPFVISRNIDNTNAPTREVGLAFQISVTRNPQTDDPFFNTPTDPRFDPLGARYLLDNEPGAAITHQSSGGASQGSLNFKTKTLDGSHTAAAGNPLDNYAGSLTTKLRLTKDGYLLLGSEDEKDLVIDFRLTGSEFPLIQGSGSNENDRAVFILTSDKDYDVPFNQTDTSFYVSGSINSKIEKPNQRNVSVFGGDLLVSGTLYAESHLRIEGEVTSSDNALLINVDHLTASNHVLVTGSVNVRQNLSASNYKGSGNELQNVNLSSIWEVDPTSPSLVNPADPVHLVLSENIDGNTGLTVFEIGSFKEDVKRMHTGEIQPDDLHLMFRPSENTRLYDTFLESNRITREDSLNIHNDESKWGQPLVWSHQSNDEVPLPPSTVRVGDTSSTKDYHLMISSKV